MMSRSTEVETIPQSIRHKPASREGPRRSLGTIKSSGLPLCAAVSIERGKLKYFSTLVVRSQFHDGYLAQASHLFWQAGASRVHHQNSLAFLDYGVVRVAENNDIDNGIEYSLEGRR